MSLDFKLVLGGPGVGKTEYLIDRVERHLSSGLRPDEIAFVAFTRAAAEEARTRTAAALGMAARELPHFRTLHSLCFRELGLRRGDVLEGASLRELEKLTGEKAGRDLIGGEAGPWEIEQLARASGRVAETLAISSGIDIHRYRRAVAARDRFKEKRNLLDFTDMLERYADDGRPVANVRIAIIDEVQDLTPLQWRVAERAFSNCERVIVAGDDEQAIHEWAGSTIEPLLAHAGEREILTKSHRLPREIHSLSRETASLITNRIVKSTVPADRDGEIAWYADPTEVPLSLPGTWLLLARARYQLEELAAAARAAGVPYTLFGKSSINAELVEAARNWEREHATGAIRWHDALTNFPLEDREYLLACRRAGEKLNVAPRVSIDTVHGAKGRQADHVLLLTDLTARVHQRAEEDPDAELRVAYVGLTRARETLHLVQPRGPHGWRI